MHYEREKQTNITSDDGFDSHDRQPVRIRIGFIDEVNGPCAEPVPEYKPTRFELLQLAEYWLRRALELSLCNFQSGVVGSSDMRIIPYAFQKAQTISDCLGADEFEEVQNRIENSLRRAVGDRVWRAFIAGDQNEALEIQKDFHRPNPNLPKR